MIVVRALALGPFEILVGSVPWARIWNSVKRWYVSGFRLGPMLRANSLDYRKPQYGVMVGKPCRAEYEPCIE